jgi:hypothetical protein
MTAPQEERARWTILEAERLLMSLPGVVSARVVARPGGDVDEIHLLTTTEIKPKQTVRNVESALLARLDLHVDHRKISVAQTTTEKPAMPVPAPATELERPLQLVVPERKPYESRLLFYGHQVESERSNTVKHKVEIEWRDKRYVGTASAADVARAKLEAVAEATLRAVEAALQDNMGEGKREAPTLSLDGVKTVEAFDRKFVLVAVHAIAGRDVSRLAGTHVADESTDRAAILATLQATDRWVRGNFYT